MTERWRFSIYRHPFSRDGDGATGWDLTPLESYTTFGVANHFHAEMLQTDRGKARIQGLASTVCDTDTHLTRREALLGMTLKTLQFEEWSGKTSVPMSIQGYEAGSINYDVIEPPEEKGQDR